VASTAVRQAEDNLDTVPESMNSEAERGNNSSLEGQTSGKNMTLENM
jgi:hypothetical protein